MVTVLKTGIFSRAPEVGKGHPLHVTDEAVDSWHSFQKVEKEAGLGSSLHGCGLPSFSLSSPVPVACFGFSSGHPTQSLVRRHR